MMETDAVMSWKDPDRDGFGNPAGLIDLAATAGGMAQAPTNGAFTYGCCDTTAGSFAICSEYCNTSWC